MKFTANGVEYDVQFEHTAMGAHASAAQAHDVQFVEPATIHGVHGKERHVIAKTKATLMTADGEVCAHGFAFCSIADFPNRRVGETVALRRAIEDADPTPEMYNEAFKSLGRRYRKPRLRGEAAALMQKLQSAVLRGDVTADTLRSLVIK